MCSCISLLINSLSASHYNWCTATLLNRIITAQREWMGDVGSARYEPALLPPSPTIRVLSNSNCQRSTHSHQQFNGFKNNFGSIVLIQNITWANSNLRKLQYAWRSMNLKYKLYEITFIDGIITCDKNVISLLHVLSYCKLYNCNVVKQVLDWLWRGTLLMHTAPQ